MQRTKKQRKVNLKLHILKFKLVTAISSYICTYLLSNLQCYYFLFYPGVDISFEELETNNCNLLSNHL